MPYFGGNSAINGGLFAAPGTPLQEKEGVSDSVDKMVADQLLSGRGVAYEDLLRHVASNAADALKFCEDAGAKFHPYLRSVVTACLAHTRQPSVVVPESRNTSIERVWTHRLKAAGALMSDTGALQRCTGEKKAPDTLIRNI